MSMGRAGFKQPGYRSVKRVMAPPPGEKCIVHSKQVHGEWRIAANEAESEITFEETVPSDCLVQGSSAGDAAGGSEQFRAWRGADMTEGAWDVNVVVWQWCRGVPVR